VEEYYKEMEVLLIKCEMEEGMKSKPWQGSYWLES